MLVTAISMLDGGIRRCVAFVSLRVFRDQIAYRSTFGSSVLRRMNACKYCQKVDNYSVCVCVRVCVYVCVCVSVCVSLCVCRLIFTLLSDFPGGKATTQRHKRCHPLATCSNFGFSVSCRMI